MSMINVVREGSTAVISLNNPPFHELNPGVMNELAEVHRSLASDRGVHSVILTSDSDKFFCNGLSPDYILEQDDAGRAALFTTLMELMEVMYTFPKYEVCAINGHAMAGGAVLAILCDARFMAEDNKARFSFTEVAVGLVIPPILLDIIERVTGPGPLRDIAMLAGVYKADEAQQLGLVDQIMPAAELIEETRRYLSRIEGLPAANLAYMKHNIRRDVIARMKEGPGSDAAEMQRFLGDNFIEGITAVKERRRPRFKN